MLQPTARIRRLIPRRSIIVQVTLVFGLGACGWEGERVELTPPPRWVSSLHINSTESSFLIIVDPTAEVEDGLLFYDHRGSSLRMQHPANGMMVVAMQAFGSGDISRVPGSGYIAQTDGPKFLHFDDQLKLRSEVFDKTTLLINGAAQCNSSIETESNFKFATIGMPIAWHFSAERLFLLGDIQVFEGPPEDSEGSWMFGLLEIDRSASRPSFNIIGSLHSVDESTRDQHLDQSTRDRHLYARFPVLTVVKNYLYFLHLEENPTILRYRIGSCAEPRVILALSERPFQLTAPNVPRRISGPDVGSVFKAQEMSDMPIGLFNWEDRLVLASRRRAVPGATTDWELHLLKGARSSSLELDRSLKLTQVSASHLMIAPGDPEWVFLEQGTVESLGFQNQESILILPNSRIQHCFHKSGDGVTAECPPV